MVRLVILAVSMVALLGGCGQVIVFGHVMGERRGAESSTEATAADGTSSTSMPASGAADGPATPSQATAPTAAGSTAGGNSGTGGTSGTSGNTGSSGSSGTQLAAASPHVVKAVNIIITPEAASKVTGDASRFTADALLDAIKTELKTRKLLDDQSPNASGTAEIVVDDLATRPTTNAILFGYKMLAGTLEGDIRVTGSSNTDSTGKRIVAQSKLTVAANGEDKNPLGPLYRRFAVLAADRLAGVTSKPEEASGIPRF